MVNYHRRIMKHIIFSIIFLIASTTLLAYDANSAANALELAVSDISCRLIPNTQNIEDEVIVLYSEGSGIRVQLATYRCNPFMTGFYITSTMNEGSNGAPDSVSVNVVPMVPEPYKNTNVLQQWYSVSFIIHDVEANSLYFSCLWYEGKVSLTGSKSLTLKDSGVEVTVDDVIYEIYESKQFAVLSNGRNAKGELTIPSELSCNGKDYPVKAIKSRAFTGCSTITAVTIPESVIAIESEAFKGCSNLSAINNGANVELVASTAFGGTPWFDNQPDGVVYFGKALCACKGNLPEGTDLIIKEGTMSITPGAFESHKGLSSVTIPEGITNIGVATFLGCSDLVSVKFPESLTIIENEAFQCCDKITSIHFPSNMKYICHGAFDNCRSITSVNIPEGVESIGDGAFFYCNNMIAITLPESLKKIGRDAFRNCKSLSDIKTPDNVEEISYGAFLGCAKLNSITLSENLKFIGEGAFQYCSDLSTIVCNAQIPPIEIPNPDKSYYYPGDAFYQVDKQNCKLYVPKGCEEAYRAADLWKDFNIIEMGTGISEMENDRVKSEKYDAIYDLQGRKIANGQQPMSKGLYIVNGKKVAVK